MTEKYNNNSGERVVPQKKNGELEKSTTKTREDNKKGNRAGIVGAIILGSISILLLAGLTWGYVTMGPQSNNGVVYDSVPNTAEQTRLDKEFVVTTADNTQEVNDLKNYDTRHSSFYEFCTNFMERDNNVNEAMSRFNDKEVIYYRQTAVLDESTECDDKMNTLNNAITNNNAANSELFVQNMKQCRRVLSNPIADSEKLRNDYQEAYDNAERTTTALNNAETAVSNCLA